MTPSPVISVLIPAHNAAPFLEDAVRSILSQTETDWEMVLINDGSTDATAEVAARLCAEDRRIRYFEQENRGIVATLNRGLDLCRGELIARMDADDVARPDRLRKQRELLERHPSVVVCGSEATRFGGATGRIRRPGSDRACRSWMLLDPCFVHPSVMFRRSVVDRGIRYRAEAQFCEDYAFWGEVAELGEMRNIREPLLRYRVHAGQITHSWRAQQERLHVDLSAAYLGRAGVPVDRKQLRDVLLPQRSTRSRAAILWSAAVLFARMAVRGLWAPYLMAGTCSNIVRHERPRAAAQAEA